MRGYLLKGCELSQASDRASCPKAFLLDHGAVLELRKVDQDEMNFNSHPLDHILGGKTLRPLQNQMCTRAHFSFQMRNINDIYMQIYIYMYILCMFMRHVIF